MRRSKHKPPKRFSSIPKKIRNLLTKKVNGVCREEQIDYHEIGIVIIDILEFAENQIKEKPHIKWRKLFEKVGARVYEHVTILKGFMVQLPN